MYTLVLTRGDRKAIDWVGGRYDHGDLLYDVLMDWGVEMDVDWDSDETMILDIPEHIAWEISVIGQASEFRWDCFAEALVDKLNAFCAKLV